MSKETLIEEMLKLYPDLRDTNFFKIYEYHINFDCLDANQLHKQLEIFFVDNYNLIKSSISLKD